MYRLVPRGLRDAGPNPQPALPQRLHFSSSSSSLLRTYCFWLRLRRTELGRILFSSFSPGDSLNQSPGSLFGSPAASFWRPLGFASPPHDGFAFIAALLRKMRLLVLLSASRASHANIISESQCLGAGLPLFTELPRRDIPGDRASGVFSETQRLERVRKGDPKATVGAEVHSIRTSSVPHPVMTPRTARTPVLC